MRKGRVAFCLLIAMLFSLGGVAQKKEVTLADFIDKGTFRAKSVFGIASMNDGVHYSARSGGSILKYSYQTGNVVDTLVSSNVLAKAGIKMLVDYSFSNDESLMLLSTNYEPIYRRSYTADYFIYNIATKQIKPLSTEGKQSLATFSPDGSKVAFTRGNNLYYTDLNSGKEVQITTDGKFNEIINGSTDWVYEEEFGFTRGFDWSPDSKKLAYYRFNESRVKLFNMNKFEGELYPSNYAYKYPKAGEKNSIVSIYCFDLGSSNITKMDVGDEDNQYIARIKWTMDANKLSMIRLNRLQNQLDILVGDASTGAASVLYTEKNSKYIEEVTDSYLTFLGNGKQFIISSEKDGYNHLYLYDMSGKEIRQLTKGNWEVTSLLGIDEKKGLAYYQAAAVSPMQREVYVTSLNGKVSKKLSDKVGTNNAIFSTGCKYYINFYSSTSTPSYITLNEANGKQIRVLEDNEALKQKVEQYNIAPKEFFTFTTDGGVVLNGWMIKPTNFDPNKKYPVFMTQYSGPGSQQVLDSWGLGWENYLAQEGYLVVCVDGRGTGARGEAFKKVTYGQLGKYEVIDQINAAKYVGSLSYADKDRIGIWGWSYGGFMSLNAIFQGADVFKMAIAVAPVTNWRFYDSIYTERFNGLPQENPSGYDDNSPINHVNKLKGRVLIVHGTADDNVHIQNTYELVSKLIQANKQYDMMIYPDKNHSIYGGMTRTQLYNKFVDYIQRNL